jgi:hypothetical protein
MATNSTGVRCVTLLSEATGAAKAYHKVGIVDAAVSSRVEAFHNVSDNLPRQLQP